MPSGITAAWNTFQEIDFCEGETFNINIKMSDKIKELCYLIKDNVTTSYSKL